MNTPLIHSNLGVYWAHLVVAELKRLGITRVFVSPGHRNAPLITALVADADIHKHTCMDERAAAYHALGYTKATGKPGVVICTSGTAACNYFPALAEAREDLLPLLVISSDRPFALIHSGANQVLDQTNLFGKFVKQAISLPEPTYSVKPQVVLEHVNMLIQSATRWPAGPVHLNMPFSEPLGPIGCADPALEAYIAQGEEILVHRASTPSAIDCQLPALHSAAYEYLLGKLQTAKRGLLIVGRLAPEADRNSIRALAQKLAWPVYYDLGSGMLWRDDEAALLDPEIPAMRAALEVYRPDVVLQLGRRPVTKWFESLRKKIKPDSYLVVNAVPNIQDELYERDLPLLADEGELAQTLCAALPPLKHDEAARANLYGQVADLKHQLHAACQDGGWNFPTLAYDLLHHTPSGSLLYLGNSSSIRYADTWGIVTRGMEVQIAANRGVSGIEGQLATVLGMTEEAGKPTVALLGDVTLIHDLNSILEMGQASTPVVLIVANNREGGIFRKLPIAKFDDVMNPMMLTPHHFKFEGVAAMAGVAYHEVCERGQFTATLRHALASGQSALIECVLNSEADLKFIQSIYGGLANDRMG